MDIIQRFEKSLTAYNRAAGLMDRGELEAAESMLREALSLYPREFLMEPDPSIDETIRASFETLFRNIRDRLETIEALLLPPELDLSAVGTLQDLVQQNIARKSEPKITTDEFPDEPLTPAEDDDLFAEDPELEDTFDVTDAITDIDDLEEPPEISQEPEEQISEDIPPDPIKDTDPQETDEETIFDDSDIEPVLQEKEEDFPEPEDIVISDIELEDELEASSEEFDDLQPEKETEPEDELSELVKDFSIAEQELAKETSDAIEKSLKKEPGPTDGLSVKLGDKLIEKSIEETFDLESLDSVSEEDNPEATIDYEEKNPLADDIAESLRLPPAEEVLRQLSEESEMHLSAAREQAGSDVDSETETSPQNEEIPDADIVETDNSEADEIIDAINVEDTPLPDETSDEIESESTLSEAEPDDEQESRSEAPDEEEIETPEISSRDETGELVSALLEENIEPEVQKSETEQTQYAQTPPEQAKENIEEKTEELEYASETSPNEQQDIETTDSDDNQIKETAAEIMLEETETPKETFFTKIKSQLGRIFSKSQKKEEEELPLLDGDGPVLEQEASEEQIDETAPEEVLQEEEPAAPEPAPEEPVEQKDEIEDDDDDDEALLNEEEFEKLKIKPVQQTIIERTTINTSSVFATIFVILMFVAGGSGLVYKVFFDQSELQVLYSKADKSINSENPEIDKATEYANGYQTTLGANSAKQSESFIAASWANHLRESSGESEKASILLKIFRGQNIRSRVLDEELVKTLIAQCGSAIKTGNTAKAKQYFKEATDILQEGLVLEGQAHSYRKQLAKLGYLLNSQTVTDSLARKDLDSAHAALKGMLSLEKYLTQKEANDIDNITQRTANQLINEAQSAYNKRDYALAAKLAGQALDLTAGNTKAKNILVRARARLK